MSNIVLNSGSGGSTIATDTVSAAEHQLVKLEFGAAASATMVSTSNGLPVDVLDRSLRDNGKIDVSKIDALPSADYDTGAGVQNVPMIGVGFPASGGTVPAPGTTANGLLVDVSRIQGTVSDNVTQWAGTAVDVNSGAKSAGTLRVVLATDQPALTAALKVDGSAVTQPVSGTFWQATQPVSAASLPLPTGASTAAKQPALGTAGTPSTDVLTIQGAASMTKLLVTPDSVALPLHQSVNVDQLAGTTPDTNSGTKSAGTLRVVLATDQPALTAALKVDGSAVTQPVSLATLPVTNAGTFAVQPGPATSGGALIYHAVAAASTNAASVKASAGQVYGWSIFNNATYTIYVKFYNTAGVPTVGTGVVYTIGVPAGGGSNIDLGTGALAFATGIGLSATQGITDADATALALSDCVINIHYK